MINAKHQIGDLVFCKRNGLGQIVGYNNLPYSDDPNFLFPYIVRWFAEEFDETAFSEAEIDRFKENLSKFKNLASRIPND
jgi:hypothetical protein